MCFNILIVQPYLAVLKIVEKSWLQRFPDRWKYQTVGYMPLLKLQFEAIISAKHVLITYIYTFVDNLPLTNIKGQVYDLFINIL